MTKPEVKTAIIDGGLRYKTKTPGSPFKAAPTFGGATMSCFLCGKHRDRSAMKTRKVLGRGQAVCSPSCEALDAAAKQHAAGQREQERQGTEGERAVA